MSRFFDFLQKVNAPPGNAEIDLEPVSTNVARAEARQILSVLRRPNGLGDLGEKDPVAELEPVAVEELQVVPGSRFISYNDPSSLAADRFRLLRMRLRQLGQTKKLNRLLITSPLPQDGKTTIALNLAMALSELGKRKVLLIDADLHRSLLNRQLGIDLRIGLAECLETAVNPLSLIRRLQPLNWYLLPAGHATANPTELLQTEALAGVMQKLAPHFDWILMDSPPVIPLTDSVCLTRYTDATLLIARADSTRQKAIDDAIALLGRQHVLGIILNGVKGLERAYSKYHGYYGKHSGGSSAETDRGE